MWLYNVRISFGKKEELVQSNENDFGIDHVRAVDSVRSVGDFYLTHRKGGVVYNPSSVLLYVKECCLAFLTTRVCYR